MLRFKYENIIYKSPQKLINQLQDDEKVGTVLYYKQNDYISEYYALKEDIESNTVNYQIEDPANFLIKFADKLNIKIIV